MAVFRQVLFTCTLLLAGLSSVSAIQKLNSIKQLKKLDFGGSIPKHSLLLLHWFANIIDITNNDIIYLTFDLNDYGTHHYGNYEGILNLLPQGNTRYRYYTVGNLVNQNDISDFPNYVINPPNRYRAFGNQDRIVFRVRESNNNRQNQQIIDEVYLTQHYGQRHTSTSYDPDFTYRISTNLLREIRLFSVDEDQSSTLTELRDDFQDDINDNELRNIKTTWRNLAILGLFLYIVIEKKHSVCKNNQPQKNKQKDFVVNIPDSTPHRHTRIYTPRYYDHHNQVSLQQHLTQDSIELKVTTGEAGKARIEWRDVPRHRIKEQAMVVLYKKDETDSCYQKLIGTTYGVCNTSVLLNEGLHARLHKVRTTCCFWKRPAEEITKGPAFTSPEPVLIPGYDASLQLFVEDGKACARIFIPHSFCDWRTVFKDAWVGFYSSADKDTDEYEFWKWQWVTKFTLTYQQYNATILEYRSRMTINRGVQARLIMDKLAKARSPCWQ